MCAFDWIDRSCEFWNAPSILFISLYSSGCLPHKSILRSKPASSKISNWPFVGFVIMFFQALIAAYRLTSGTTAA
jgi:hypothetical protein